MDNSERPKAGKGDILDWVKQLGFRPEPKIVIEEVPEVKIEGAGVTFQEAADEAMFDNYLGKPLDYDKAVDALPIDGQTKDRLKRFSQGRAHYHVLRLLQQGRSRTERDFGLAYMQFSDDIYDELLARNRQSATRMYSVINAETSDTTMWWTMAPYLYLNLTQHGVESREAVRRIIEWAKDGAFENDDEGAQINLHGLESMNDMGYGQNTYVLSPNPNGPSHILTNHLARQIVDAYL